MRPTVAILYERGLSNILRGETGRYAEEELFRFINEAGGPDLAFTLESDPSLPEYAYGFDGHIRNCPPGGAQRKGSDLGGIPCAGSRWVCVPPAFITKPAAPKWDALRTRSIITPFVRLRGIRQHINFPMDISSYALDEAQEYIRSLVHMGMNAMTFHSYDGMWHHDPCHFFYDEPHPLPDREDLRQADRKERTHIISECEPFVEDEEERGRFYVRWLNEVMRTAKTCGMHVNLSIEPPADIHVAEEAIDFYLQIDIWS